MSKCALMAARKPRGVSRELKTRRQQTERIFVIMSPSFAVIHVFIVERKWKL